MALKRKYLLIAVALTLDLIVAFRYGVAVWKAYSDLLPLRLLLVLFVAVWITSLADLWARAVRLPENAPYRRRLRLFDVTAGTATDAEASDV